MANGIFVDSRRGRPPHPGSMGPNAKSPPELMDSFPEKNSEIFQKHLFQKHQGFLSISLIFLSQ